MAVRIQIRRGAAAEWTAANPVLLAGELGLETDTLKVKAGDGAVAWNSLAYLPSSGGGGGGAVSSVNGQTGAVSLAPADVGAAPAGTGAAAVAGHVAASNPHSQYALATSLAAVAASGAYADLTGRPAMSTVATSGAYSDLTGRPTLGTAAALNAPASGDAATGEVVKGSDTRLSDARTPTTHTHAASQISDSTAAGRTLLTAADAAAQRTALGLGTAATQASTAFAAASHTHPASQISDSTAAGRALLTATDAAAQRTAMGVPAGSGTTSGTNTGDQDLSGYATTAAVVAGYQPLDAELTAIAGLTSAADRLPYFTGSGAAALATFTAAGRALVDDADAAAQRATLGLSTIARSVFVNTPVDGTLVVEAKAAFAFTIAQVRGLKTSSGSLSLAVQVNGTNVTGLSGLSVTTSAQDASATAANAVSVGDRVTVVISSSSGPANLEFTLSATR